MTKQNEGQVWFVTGASKGLGLSLIKKLLGEGYKVAATSRNIATLTTVVGNNTEHFLPLEVDLLDESSVQQAVDQIVDAFGAIDVVVNNAGYGQFGTVEETTDEEARQNYDVNVFGTLNVIRGVMPHLREQRSGHIFNISSIGGFVSSFTGWGVYCSTKFAVSGLTEALHTDVKPLGIHVTLVYPGYFRTNFLTDESLRLPSHPIADYEGARQSQEYHVNSINGNQPGDPDKAAEAMIQAALAEEPPLHLFLGSDAYEVASAKLAALQKDLNDWKDVSLSTDIETVLVGK